MGRYCRKLAYPPLASLTLCLWPGCLAVRMLTVFKACNARTYNTGRGFHTDEQHKNAEAGASWVG